MRKARLAKQSHPSESLAEAFATQARRHPERAALCADGGRTWSYGELAGDAWALADELIQLGVEPESCVAVVGGRTAETVGAMLGVLKAGGAYCVIDPKLPVARQRQMLEALSPAAAVIVDPDQACPPDLLCPVIRPRRAATRVSGALPLRSCDASRLAYVLFTSGSTGRPKGVMVEHASVLNMLRSFENLAQSANGFTGALIAPIAFDVSVWDIFSVLVYGGTLHVPSDGRLTGGDELWDYLCEAAIESAYIPPGLISSVAEAAERRRGTLRRVLVGVEPIPQSVLQRFCDACPELSVVNGYGPTEATITATLHLFDYATEPNRRVPIGRPVAGSRVEIVDEGLSLVPPGEVGEILIFGDCLARGYLNDENGGFIDVGGVRAYRTGDYGRLLANGTIEFIGRNDGQFKISGFRVETAEVEAVLNAMPDVRRGVVLVAGNVDARRLIAAVETPTQVSASDIRDYLMERLPVYSVPSRIMVLSALPLTANGKVDSQMLLDTDRRRPMDLPAFVTPETPWHREVAEAWSAVLGVAEVGIDDDFHQLGGTSLDAVRIAAYLCNRHRRVLASNILAARKIRCLAEPTTDARPSQVVAPGTYPASRAHEGLWVWREMNPEATRTTVVHAIKLEGVIDRARIEQAILRVVERHEALRTNFEMRSGQSLVQRIAPPSRWELAAVKIESPTEIEREIHHWLDHRFDVRVQPWTARLLIGQGFGALVFAADHLVFDGESAIVLQREVARLYDDPKSLNGQVPGPASLASRLSPSPQRVRELHAWWNRARIRSADPPVLPEPLTRETAHMRLRRHKTCVDDAVWAEVMALARVAGTTPFVVLLAALKAFLRARGNGEDNTVTVAMSRRHALGCTNAIGHFVNLVPIWDRLEKLRTASVSFTDYVARTANRFCNAIEHGDLPFEDIIAHFERPSSTRVAAPAQIVLVQQVAAETYTSKSGLQFAPWSDQPSNAIYDLTVFLSEASQSSPTQIEWVWAPATTLKHSVEWMIDAFLTFLRTAVAEPTAMLSSLPVLASKERQFVAATAKPRALSQATERETLISLFEAQVALRPDDVAVQESETLVSYAQLANRASKIAHTIATAGCGHPVVIALDKSVDQLAAMLAALKSGSPYLPLAPDHARTRLPDVAVRAGARTCVTDTHHAPAIRLPDHCRLVLVNTLPSAEAPWSPMTTDARVGPDDLAYVMPTSGSTGAPKLVGVPNRAVVRLVFRNETLPLDETDRTMLVANASFDAATLEIWGALVNGGRVVVPTSEQLLEPELLCAAIERHGVTAGFFTTTFFERLLPYVDRLAGMRHVIVGGEEVPPRLFEYAAGRLPRGALVNGYGPTENTTFSCCFRLDRDSRDFRSLPIGAPISGSGAIVVDDGLRPLPPGTPGEILVTGAGLAVGYIGDVDLTRQRFVSLDALDGERAYRTGDMGRLLPSGMFEYLGRLDRQLKIRGFRVEPGEVEAVLSAHSAIRRCVVYADDLGGLRTLVAAIEAEGVNEMAVRTWLAERVPPYLLPTRIHVVDKMPMTPNGKLDHAALRDTTATLLPSQPQDEAPRTDLERLIAKVASQLLGRNELRLDEDLFDLGADSLAALTLAARLSEHVGRPVPSPILFSARTVRSLARRIEMTAAPTDSQTAKRVRDRAARIRTLSLR